MKTNLLHFSLLVTFFIFGICHSANAISEYCGTLIGSGDNVVAMTWTTDKAGNVHISIEDVSGEDPSATSFRVAMAINNFRVDSVSADTFFTSSYNGPVCTLQLTDPAIRPSSGDVITYTGYMEYRTALDGNAYPTVNCSYTYGSTCASLTTPVVDSITPDGVLTFSAVASALTYVASVLYNDVVLYQQEVVSGDQLNFRPYITDTVTYQVVLEARAGEQYSDLSEPVDWVLVGNVANLPQSMVCESKIQGFIDNTQQSYLSFETDTKTGLFTIHIAADTANVDSITYFRNTGMSPDGFLYDGQPMSLYFTRDNSVDTKKDIIYTPNTTGDYIPCYGHTITFNTTKTYYIEWYVDGLTAAPFTSSYSYEYIYGTNCLDPTTLLAIPTALTITEAGVVTFVNVENAGLYEVEISDADDVLLTQMVQSGDTLIRDESIVDGFVYYIRIRALPAKGDVIYRTSDWSERVEWDLSDVQTALSTTNLNPASPQKRMLNGQMYILKNGKMYSIYGVKY